MIGDAKITVSFVEGIQNFTRRQLESGAIVATFETATPLTYRATGDLIPAGEYTMKLQLSETGDWRVVLKGITQHIRLDLPIHLVDPQVID